MRGAYTCAFWFSETSNLLLLEAIHPTIVGSQEGFGEECANPSFVNMLEIVQSGFCFAGIPSARAPDLDQRYKSHYLTDYVPHQPIGYAMVGLWRELISAQFSDSWGRKF